MRQNKNSPRQSHTLHFGPRNIVLLAAGLAVITAGYILLAGGSTVAAPLALLLGYVVLIPLGLIL